MMSDILGTSISDSETDSGNTSNPPVMLAATVQPLTYTTKEDALFNNALWN
jgi:hypothetical protein